MQYKYGHQWSQLRSVSNEIVNERNMKVNVDNLTFTKKIAKKIQDGFGGIKRRLYLLTCQRTFTKTRTQGQKQSQLQN